MPDDAYRFTHRLRVRWSECDPQGIVFNPHYMMYADVGFTEYTRAIGVPYPAGLVEDGVDNFMIAAQITYRASARFDDELDIAVRTAYFGTTSFRMAFEIRRAGTVLAQAEATYVIADLTSRTPRPIPASLRAKVLAFERVPPAEKSATG